MTHRRAVALMVLVTLLWSTAGVVTRHLEAARGFEVTFWRSAFTALSLLVMLRALRGPALWQALRCAPRLVWLSGVCWAVMFTAFMQAVLMTSVANVLVTMAVSPLLTALFARVFLGHRLAPRVWAAIWLASAGIAWMFGHELQSDGHAWAGMLVALLVPLSAATNWNMLQHIGGQDQGQTPDMLLAVLIGAVFSAMATWPLALPLRATGVDMALLAFLGATQLAIPCLLVVRISRELAAPEIALLGLLEVVFGVLLAWVGAGERPTAVALQGGAVVLGALVANETLGALKGRRAAPGA